ncbi:MAG: extracellular solute-binding protein [Candidatus Bathyarchaeia archaeon]
MGENKNEKLGKKRISRREALSTAAKIGIGVVVAGVVAGVGGYYAGSVAAPPKTVTVTEARERTVTQTVTVTAPTAAPPTTVVAPAKPPYEGVKLTICGDAGHNQMPFYWEKDHIAEILGVELDIVGVPFGELVDKIMIDFATGAGAYDIVVFPPFAGGDFYGGEFLVNIDPFIERGKADPENWDIKWDDIIPTFRELYCSWGGKRYAVTWDGDHYQCYFRKDVLLDPKINEAFKNKYGYKITDVIKSGGESKLRYDKEWLEIAEFFTQAYNPDSPTKYGTSELAGRGNNQWHWNSRFGSAGGIYFDMDMHPLINKEPGVRALKNFVDVIKYCPPGVLDFGYEEHKDAFLLGDAAIIVQWPCIGKKGQDPAQSKIVDNLGYTLVPGFEVGGMLNQRGNLAFGRVLAISKFAENYEAAYRVIQYLSGPRSWWATKWVADPRTGLDLFRYYHIENPNLWYERWKSDPETAGISWKALPEYLQSAKINIEHGFPEPTIPGTPELYDALTIRISAALGGEIDPKKALDEAAAEWESIIDRLGRDYLKRCWASLIGAWKEVGLIKE